MNQDDGTEAAKFICAFGLLCDIRTSLLPFDELLSWSGELEAPAARNDPARFEQALAADRKQLRERLFGLVSREEVRDAIFVASPDLD